MKRSFSAGGDIACNLAICIKSPTELKELTDDTCDSSLKLLLWIFGALSGSLAWVNIFKLVSL